MEGLDINIGQSADNIAEQRNLKAVMVDIDLIEDNPINKDFYSIGSLEEIQKSMEDRELLTPLIAVNTPEGKKRLVSGHRRKAAALRIFAKGKPIKYCGKEYFNQLPVITHPPFEGDGETKAIVDANVYRDKSDEERKNEISFLYGHYKELKESGELKKGNSNIVEHIANDTKLGMTKTKELLNKVPEYASRKRSRATKIENNGKDHISQANKIISTIKSFSSFLQNLTIDDLDEGKQKQIRDELEEISNSINNI